MLSKSLMVIFEDKALITIFEAFRGFHSENVFKASMVILKASIKVFKMLQANFVKSSRRICEVLVKVESFMITRMLLCQKCIGGVGSFVTG